jgi:hypothetical protein
MDCCSAANGTRSALASVSSHNLSRHRPLQAGDPAITAPQTSLRSLVCGAGAPRLIRACGDYWMPRLKRGMTPEDVIGLSRMLKRAPARLSG